MIAVTSPGFVLFAALLAGLWYVCPPPRRWQLMLGANLVFYAVLCWQALPVLLACTPVSVVLSMLPVKVANSPTSGTAADEATFSP